MFLFFKFLHKNRLMCCCHATLQISPPHVRPSISPHLVWTQACSCYSYTLSALFQLSFSSISALSQHTASDRRSLKYFVLFDDQYLLPEKKRFSELADEIRSRDPVINTNKSLPITQNHESPGHFPLPG